MLVLSFQNEIKTKKDIEKSSKENEKQTMFAWEESKKRIGKGSSM